MVESYLNKYYESIIKLINNYNYSDNDTTESLQKYFSMYLNEYFVKHMLSFANNRLENNNYKKALLEYMNITVKPVINYIINKEMSINIKLYEHLSLIYMIAIVNNLCKNYGYIDYLNGDSPEYEKLYSNINNLSFTDYMKVVDRNIEKYKKLFESFEYDTLPKYVKKGYLINDQETTIKFLRQRYENYLRSLNKKMIHGNINFYEYFINNKLSDNTFRIYNTWNNNNKTKEKFRLCYLFKYLNERIYSKEKEKKRTR